MAFRTPLVVTAVVALVATVLVATGAPAAPTAARPGPAKAAKPPLLDVDGDNDLLLSPNDDGRHDRIRVRFALRRSAKVTVRVRDVYRDRVVRGPVKLGKLGEGKHVWRWDGRRDGGRVVPDGYVYRVVVTARRGGVKVRDSVPVWVDTTPITGELVTTRTTVHPYATDVHDRVVLTFVSNEWAPYPGTDGVPRVELVIRRSGRDVTPTGWLATQWRRSSTGTRGKSTDSR